MLQNIVQFVDQLIDELEAMYADAVKAGLDDTPANKMLLYTSALKTIEDYPLDEPIVQALMVFTMVARMQWIQQTAINTDQAVTNVTFNERII